MTGWWEPWFAWHPVRTDKGLRWLCTVDRTPGISWRWLYRAR